MVTRAAGRGQCAGNNRTMFDRSGGRAWTTAPDISADITCFYPGIAGCRPAQARHLLSGLDVCRCKDHSNMQLDRAAALTGMSGTDGWPNLLGVSPS